MILSEIKEFKDRFAKNAKMIRLTDELTLKGLT